MNRSPVRLLKIDAVVTVAAFLLSGVLRNAKHGIGYVLGDIAWFGFLAGLLALLILGAVVAVGALRRRAAAS
jgi:predicted membrane protein